MPVNRAIFVDRDGVLTEAPPGRPPNSPEEIKVLPGVQKAIKLLHALDYLVVMVSNQGGIAKKFMTMATMVAMNDELTRQLGGRGRDVKIDMFKWCPHYPLPKVEPCGCRKPQPGMLLEVGLRLDIDLARSHMVGDMASDMAAGKAAGVRYCLGVRSPLSDFTEENFGGGLVFPSLFDVAQFITMKESL